MLMGDFSSDYSRLSDWVLEFGLIYIIATQHGCCPITYNRSSKDPLDVICTTSHFIPAACGYFSFGKLARDHRGIWVDIPKILLYGYNPPQPIFPYARRLKLSDPRVVNRYLSYLDEACQEEELSLRMNHLYTNWTTHNTNIFIQDYEELDLRLCKLMREAEARCRKFKMGSIPWSLQYKNHHMY